MKVALAQMRVIPNEPEKNLETILKMIDQAKNEKVDMIAFPELCVSGYLVGDKWLDDGFCKDMMSFNDRILQASKGIAVAWGNIFLDDGIDARVNDNAFHPNKDGRVRRYNAVYVAQNGRYVERKETDDALPNGIQPKTLLPNYRIFDDERYFFSLEDVAKDFGKKLDRITQPFVLKIDGKDTLVGFEVCEDLWCEDYRMNLSAENPTRYLINNGAELIVNISASPWTFGKNNARDKRIQFLKEDCDEFVPFLYVNCVGSQNNGKNIITFDGGSTIYDADGRPIKFASRAYQEELLVTDDLATQPVERTARPKIAEKLEAILEGIRYVKDMLGKTEQPRYVVGLSGGIDSAVVACLLTLVVGNDSVLAVNMPTQYNSDKTKNAAQHIAEKLGLAYVQIPIDEIVTVNERMLETLGAVDGGTELSSLNKENIAAKVRGTSMLSNLAAKYGALFTNNGNKLETALGYATLYGDVGGAFAPLGDLTKTEVVELAKYLNSMIFGDEVIPKSLIPDELFRFADWQIKPSAELKSDQIDPMKFGYHDALLEAFTDYKKKNPVDALNWYLAGKIEQKLGVSNELLLRWGIDNPATFVQDLEWFDNCISRNVFKRVQAPPIIITSKSSYGFDIRESILPNRRSAGYELLKKKVLAMDTYVQAKADG